MAKYYKVSLHSVHNDLSGYRKKVIVKPGIFCAKEIMTGEKIAICDNIVQGFNHEYYILYTDFINVNIATYEMIHKYMNKFKFEKFPITSKIEKKEAKELAKKYKRK